MAGAAGPMGSGLTFNGMTDQGVNSGFDLKFALADRAASLFLCVGEEENRVEVTGTTPKSRQAKVLAAIDDLGKWGENVPLWMVAEKGGTLVARTPAVSYKTHVKPFYGELKISHIAVDDPKMTYPGNGSGRVLTPKINDRYYFCYGKPLVFETNNAMRGFDCTSFPMALFSVPYLPPPGYGKQLCDALRATKCDLELLKSRNLEKMFQDDVIDYGYYVLFSEGHVMLYDSYKNFLYEFNYGGFIGTPAGQKPLEAKNALWWMRKLSQDKAVFFQ